jgi:hypothetical protein
MMGGLLSLDRPFIWPCRPTYPEITPVKTTIHTKSLSTKVHNVDELS